MNTVLLRAIRVIVRADTDPVRQTLFANLRQARRSVRLAYGLHERLAATRLSALLPCCYGAAHFVAIARPRPSARVLTVARHANARRRVDRVADWIGPGSCARVDTRPRIGTILPRVAALTTANGRRGARRAIRIVRRLEGRHGFLVGCRVAGALAWYGRGLALLQTERPDAILVSSDSNPEEVGFTAAARALGVATIFVSHAYPTPFSPPLDFTLSILEGRAEARARARGGTPSGAIVLAGIEGRSAPIDALRFERETPAIGVFAPKAVSWPALVAVVAQCRERFAAREIIVRWHPSMLEPPRLHEMIDDRTGIVETPKGAALADVAARCDWVIADENSGVHLPVLRMGIPTVAIRHLGLYPPSRSDLYGFGVSGVVMPAVSSLADLRPDAVRAFFSDGWAARFAEYDASYLQPQETVGHDVRRAIAALLEHRGQDAAWV